jgi:hypothetical protein
MNAAVLKKLEAMKSGDVVMIKISWKNTEEVYKYIYDHKIDILMSSENRGVKYPQFRLRKQ